MLPVHRLSSVCRPRLLSILCKLHHLHSQRNFPHQVSPSRKYSPFRKYSSSHALVGGVSQISRAISHWRAQLTNAQVKCYILTVSTQLAAATVVGFLVLSAASRCAQSPISAQHSVRKSVFCENSVQKKSRLREYESLALCAHSNWSYLCLFLVWRREAMVLKVLPDRKRRSGRSTWRLPSLALAKQAMPKA